MKIPYISDLYNANIKKGIVSKYPGENRTLFSKRRKATYQRGISLLSFIIILMVLLSPISVWAQNQPTGLTSNGLISDPGSNEQKVSLTQSDPAMTTPEEHPLGYIPNPIDLSKIKGYAVPSRGLLTYTPAFDLRTSGNTDPIEDQGPYGSCWAFATYSSLESSLLPGEVVDLSESNIVNRAGFQGLTPNSGGNIFFSAAYLTRWDGPLNETDDPYSNILGGSKGTYTTQMHVQDIYLFPTRSGPTDNDWIKYALTNYGAVYSSMYWNASHNDTSNNCTYYDPYNDGSNHAVTIIGWDDNYPANKFPHGGAPGNGAFLVKNSWGSAWGNGGYFWISYYDRSIGYSDVNVVTAGSAYNYQHIYSYDKLGITSYLGNNSSNTGYFANVFTAGSNELIKAVSFYTPYPGEKYTVKIYKDPASAADPTSGTLIDTESGSLTNPGYRTIDLATPVKVNAGQKFSVVVQVSNAGTPIPGTFYSYIPVEFADCGSPFYSNITVSPAGQGFYSWNGNVWQDITGIDSKHKANVCLKAFTDDVTTLQFRAGSYTVNENDGTLTLIVDRAGWTGNSVSVNYATTDGTALAGVNYRSPTPNPGTLTIAPLATSGTITIPILDDNLYSGHGTRAFNVTLSSPINAELGSTLTRATVTITDQDPAPVIQFDPDHNMVDIPEDTGTAVFTVMRANDAEGPVSVHYATSNGTALAGVNYEAASGTLTFDKGVMSLTIPVQILDDNLAGPATAFNLTLSDPAGGATLGPYSKLILKLQDADPLPTLNLASKYYTVNENGTDITVQVDRTNDALNDVTIDYATSDITATAPTDYTATSGTLTFPRGVMSRTITIPVKNDKLYGPDTTFKISLSNPSPGGQARVGLNDSATITLKECDPAPVIKLNATAYIVNENGCTVYVNVTRVNDAKATVSVNLATQPGTATSPADYAAYNSRVSFARGVMSQVIPITINDDGLFTYPAKQFSVVMTDPMDGATLTNASATVRIVENDPAPTISLESSGKSIYEDEGLLRVNITRSNDSTNPVSVYWSTIGGYPGYNYTASNGTVTFNQGEFTKTVQIPIIDDHIYSSVPTITFGLYISTPTGGATLKAPSSMTIYLDEADQAPILKFDAASCLVYESAGSAAITVVRVNDAFDPVTVRYNTSDGTAKAGQDYTNTSGVLTFGRGELRKTITVPIIDDGLKGPDVVFNVTLSSPTGGATIGSPGRTTVTINQSLMTFTYDLVKGWNMISVPLTLDNDSVDAFFPSNVRANLTDMWYYNNGSWAYYSGTRGYSPKYAHLTNVTPGKGYWVKLSSNSSFSISGRSNGTGVPVIDSGWTMFGVKGLNSVNATTAYPGNKDMWYYDNGQWYYYSDTRGYSPKYSHLSTLDPGKGYWVHY
jgi:C1A family cysteine protease